MTEVKAKFPELNYEQVREVLEANGTKGVVVDVRHEKELEDDGRVPGFVNVPLDQVKMAFVMTPFEFELTFHAKKPDPNNDVIFSCRSGRRALMAAEQLQQLETYPNIKVYPGSFQDWMMRGGAFIQGPANNSRVMPFADEKEKGDADAKKEGAKENEDDNASAFDGGNKSENDEK